MSAPTKRTCTATIFRSANIGYALPVVVELNGVVIGEVPEGTAVRVEIPTGPIMLKCQQNFHTWDLNEANHEYFFSLVPLVGIAQGSFDLVWSDEVAFKKTNCKVRFMQLSLSPNAIPPLPTLQSRTATLCFFREPSLLAGQDIRKELNCVISINGVVVGVLESNHGFKITGVPSGVVRIVSKGGGGAFGIVPEFMHEYEISPGKTYYFKVHLHFGIVQSPFQLVVSDEAAFAKTRVYLAEKVFFPDHVQSVASPINTANTAVVIVFRNTDWTKANSQVLIDVNDAPIPFMGGLLADKCAWELHVLSGAVKFRVHYVGLTLKPLPDRFCETTIYLAPGDRKYMEVQIKTSLTGGQTELVPSDEKSFKRIHRIADFIDLTH